jgi:hypothetical protein
MKFTPENITELTDNQIFCYGANASWKHGAGAAKAALKFGAKHGFGPVCGATYGIPTKDKNIQTLPLDKIKDHINDFLVVVEANLDYEFLLTKIGCGLCNFSIDEIANLFLDFLPLPSNLVVPVEFYNYWKANTDKEIFKNK